MVQQRSHCGSLLWRFAHAHALARKTYAECWGLRSPQWNTRNLLEAGTSTQKSCDFEVESGRWSWFRTKRPVLIPPTVPKAADGHRPAGRLRAEHRSDSGPRALEPVCFFRRREGKTQQKMEKIKVIHQENEDLYGFSYHIIHQPLYNNPLIFRIIYGWFMIAKLVRITSIAQGFMTEL